MDDNRTKHLGFRKPLAGFRITSANMNEPAALKQIADTVIRRVLSEMENRPDLGAALEREYPFGDDPLERQIWLDALLRHAHEYTMHERKKM
jgi:hypothetical protein